MSISFNHPSNTMTSTPTSGSLKIIALGGTAQKPVPIRFDASSLIVPVKDLPVGEAGSLVFDNKSLTMKYHDGSNWVELLSAADVVAPINTQIQQIINQMKGKVDTVTYSSSSIPNASISGSTLNIVFPLPSTTTGSTGLYTSSKPGSIMYYSLSSGQNIASIREQMSGKVGGQAGRNGTAGAPWITSDGWCLADGMYWTWEGESGIKTVVVPNLLQNAYFRTITTSGITKTDTPIAGSSSISPATFTIPDHYHGTGMMLASSGVSGDDLAIIFGRTWNDGNAYAGVAITGDKQQRLTYNINGNNPTVATSTTNGIYGNANDRTITHTHALGDIDVPHFNVAALYNIAEPSLALSEKVANSRYVLKTGDIMSGTLTIANNATISGTGTNLQLFFKNGAAERAAITHSSSNNTLQFRSSGGPSVTIDNNGSMIIPGNLSVTSNSAVVGGKNVVRSVNNTNADAAGNVNISLPKNSASLGTNGWFKDASTGMITQWGYQPSDAFGNPYVTVQFPIPFPNACLNVQNTTKRAEGVVAAENWSIVVSFNNTSARIGTDNYGSYWTAIGY